MKFQVCNYAFAAACLELSACDFQHAAQQVVAKLICWDKALLAFRSDSGAIPKMAGPGAPNCGEIFSSDESHSGIW